MAEISNTSFNREPPETVGSLLRGCGVVRPPAALRLVSKLNGTDAESNHLYAEGRYNVFQQAQLRPRIGVHDMMIDDVRRDTLDP